MNNDISLNTLIVSAVIAAATWALKGGIIQLIKALLANQVKMISLENQIEKVIGIIDEVPKIKLDLNASYKRIRILEERNGQADL